MISPGGIENIDSTTYKICGDGDVDLGTRCMEIFRNLIESWVIYGAGHLRSIVCQWELSLFHRE